MARIECAGDGEMRKAAESLLRQFPNNRIFAFYGDLGAGKTTIIKQLCSLLDSSTNSSSPSFSIVNVYDSPIGQIFHFDFYRIMDIKEVLDIGYEEYFFSGNYCFIEWPEKIEKLLPEGTIRVNIYIDNSIDKRVVEF